ncbi:hypothetical protein RJ641_007311 [Dillenia turbinata]|uniref:3-beta hydroxysteroid dehydrogenase/isomerase domain-containing protein n=1 Tax=Dillenia turbinata TaxID=194707 RepID=A0AAN8Z5F5_9MAGN
MCLWIGNWNFRAVCEFSNPYGLAGRRALKMKSIWLVSDMSIIKAPSPPGPLEMCLWRFCHPCHCPRSVSLDAMACTHGMSHHYSYGQSGQSDPSDTRSQSWAYLKRQNEWGVNKDRLCDRSIWVEYLETLDGPKERLQLVKASLLEERAFDSIVDGCNGVFHTASPFITRPQIHRTKSL